MNLTEGLDINFLCSFLQGVYHLDMSWRLGLNTDQTCIDALFSYHYSSVSLNTHLWSLDTLFLYHYSPVSDISCRLGINSHQLCLTTELLYSNPKGLNITSSVGLSSSSLGLSSSQISIKLGLAFEIF